MISLHLMIWVSHQHQSWEDIIILFLFIAKAKERPLLSINSSWFGEYYCVRERHVHILSNYNVSHNLNNTGMQFSHCEWPGGDQILWHCIISGNKMTLPSRHRLRNSSLGGLWPSCLLFGFRSRRLPTILNLHEWTGKKHCVSLKLECQCGAGTRDLRISKQAASTIAPEPPPCVSLEAYEACDLNLWAHTASSSVIHHFKTTLSYAANIKNKNGIMQLRHNLNVYSSTYKSFSIGSTKEN